MPPPAPIELVRGMAWIMGLSGPTLVALDRGARVFATDYYEAALDFARAAGFRSMQFNAVVETNDRAVRLWRSLGFEVIGTVPGAFDHPEHGPVGLHVMFLDLG